MKADTVWGPRTIHNSVGLRSERYLFRADIHGEVAGCVVGERYLEENDCRLLRFWDEIDRKLHEGNKVLTQLEQKGAGPVSWNTEKSNSRSHRYPFHAEGSQTTESKALSWDKGREPLGANVAKELWRRTGEDGGKIGKERRAKAWKRRSRRSSQRRCRGVQGGARGERSKSRETKSDRCLLHPI